MGAWPIRLLVAAVLIAASVVYRRIRRDLAFWSLRRQTGCAPAPCYPHRDPILGFDLYRRRQWARDNGCNMALYMAHTQLLGKTWQENTLGQRTINVMDPLNYQYVHAIAQEDFPRLVNRPSNTAVLGSGIYLTEGERWKHSREMITPIFARAGVGNMAILARHVNAFLAHLPRDCSTLDLQPLIKRLAMDLTTEFLLGESIGAQQDNPQAAEFLHTFDQVLFGWNKRRQAGLMAIRYAMDRQWPAAVQRLYRFFDGHINRVLDQDPEALAEDHKEDGADRHILLPQLAKYVRDPVALRFEILNVFIPSRDTVSALFGNMFWALSRHPEVWAELRRCAQSVNLDDGLDSPAAGLTNLAALLPFRHVVFETLRAIGPSGRQFRVARRDTTLPRGGGADGTAPAFVPRGAIICTVAHCVHHDREIWGADADEFRPARWAEEEAGDAAKRPPWTFIPFLGGPHACPAQQQVIAQATHLLWRMVQTFQTIECCDPIAHYVERQHMVIESRLGVQVSLQVAKSAD